MAVDWPQYGVDGTDCVSRSLLQRPCNLQESSNLGASSISEHKNEI